MSSFQCFLTSLKEAVADLIPIDDKLPQVEKRFVDNHRPITSEEEAFFKHMNKVEALLSKDFEIGNLNMQWVYTIKWYILLV